MNQTPSDVSLHARAAVRVLVGSNWKMHKTVREAVEFTTELLRLIGGTPELELVQLFLVPPYTAIQAVKGLVGERAWVGAQNMHWAESGPYTGEISAPMLKELGADFVELGHAERRLYFHETDSEVNRKVSAALAFGLKALICVGEGGEEKDSGAGRETVVRQVLIALKGLTNLQPGQVMIAYEPWWSINQVGGAADPLYVRQIRTSISDALERVLGPESAAAIPVIYGGDVTRGNAADLLAFGGIDGIFVGRAAWQPEGMAEMVRIAARQALLLR